MKRHAFIPPIITAMKQEVALGHLDRAAGIAINHPLIDWSQHLTPEALASIATIIDEASATWAAPRTTITPSPKKKKQSA